MDKTKIDKDYKLPKRIRDEISLNTYIQSIKDDSSANRTCEQQSIIKWQALIFFAEKFNIIPIFGGACGLCNKYDGPYNCDEISNEEWCPLYIHNECFYTRHWNSMVKQMNDQNIEKWIKSAKAFLEWMIMRINKKEEKYG